MRSQSSIRRGHAVVVGVAGMAIAATLASAQDVKVDRFSGTVVNIEQEAGSPVRVDLLRWSTDEERKQTLSAFTAEDDAQFIETLRKMPTLGYVWTSESIGYTLRYAHRLELPDGGERIVLVTDRRLGAWKARPWQHEVPAPVEYPYTLIEVRLAGGSGEAKTSLSTQVTVDAEAETMTLEDYAAAPATLERVTYTPAKG